ncbi:LOW QUALITY PROTEIN: hypothetical protein Dda_4482 [Drechslerella dactyloides]|uniref:NB-ARC domain-containing protein n=1 Tax=Drechslerella dactyloides TaxID=74499 RepID=A0AAD6NKM3_DREDA|nr:LOW QUALITY PROTEIN: hypothetical protein Dda_4482 [Drechslerella dactyloides]
MARRRSLQISQICVPADGTCADAMNLGPGSFSTQPAQTDTQFSKVLQRFRRELDGDVDQKNVPNAASLELLLKEAQNLETNATRHGLSRASMQKLEPIISHVSDFMTLIALCEGAGVANTSGAVYGSLKMLLEDASVLTERARDTYIRDAELSGVGWQLAAKIGDTAEKVVYMLHDLSLGLPKSRSYKETVPMDKDIEAALVDVYAELLCFCGRAVKFFRGNPHKALVSFSWKTLSSDFDSTLQRLRSLSKIADKEAEAARLRLDLQKLQKKEMTNAMLNLQTGEASASTDSTSRQSQNSKFPLYVIPNGINETFCGRADVLEALRQILDPIKASWNRRALLYGLGGVGKTKVALEYTNRFKDQYDAIFWITADAPEKMSEAFLQVSRRLGLTAATEGEEAFEDIDATNAKSKVKEWLQQNPCRWLLIFDNVDDPDILEDAIPATTAGAIILTAKDSSAGDIIGADSVHVKSFDLDDGLDALKSLLKQNITSPEDNMLATELVRELGGLPLAIAQISGYINQQRYSLKEFLPLYRKNIAKINQKRVGKTSYSHTISTVWDADFERLPGEASTLRNFLAFLDPDKIQDSMLLEGGPAISDQDFAFLQDEMDFAEAKTPLLRSALVDRWYETGSLSIHCLVQEAVIRQLPDAQRVKYVDAAIELLSNSFPNTWNIVTGHQFATWEKCEVCYPHIAFLAKQCEQWKVQPSNPKAYSELIFRMAWHLYEKEKYDEAKEFLAKGALACHVDQSHDLTHANVLMLRGLIDLDTNNIVAALDAFNKTLEIRQRLLPPHDEFIASSLNALSLAYTELGNMTSALKAGSKAIDIRLRNNSECLGNSYSNMASTLLRMGNLDEAEDMLRRCPNLQNLSEESFMETGNPRFSGDMVLLAKVRQQQGRLEEALRLSSKALEMRQAIFGNGLKTCDSLYQVACLLHIRKDFHLSGASLLDESINIADNIPYGMGYSARSRYKLSQIYREKKLLEFANEALMSAEVLRAQLAPQPLAPPSQEEYDKLVLFMLW